MDNFIPDNEVQIDAASMPQVHASSIPNEEVIPDNEVQLDSDKYGTTGETLKAGAEAVGRGLLGPLAPMAERLAGVKKSDILGRQQAHPTINALGETAGLIGGMLTGTGEAALMTKAGELATKAAGLGEAANFGSKVGSAAVRQAAEMAVLTSGDEASKMLVNDPDASAQNAIAHTGLAALAGGAFGAIGAGVVSPLWEATAGPKLDQLLHFVKNTGNGGSKLVMPEATEAAAKTLGIDIDPVMRSGMSNDAKAQQMFGTLRRAENTEVLKKIDEIHQKSADAVMNSLGTTVEDVANFDKNEQGHALKSTLINELKTKFGPAIESLEKRNAEAALINLTDDSKLRLRDKLLEQGLTKHSANDEFYDIYRKYGDKILDADNVAKLDSIKTELGNSIGTFGKDLNAVNAYKNIRSEINDFVEDQISKAADETERLGVTGARKAGQNVITERRFTNQQYKEVRGMLDDVMDHTGMGKVSGLGGAIKKIEDGVTPENILSKFSIKNNMDSAKFLSEHFPDTFNHVLSNERKEFLKPAILSAARKSGELPIDINKLSKSVADNMAGRSGYLQTILPPEALQKIEAAQTLAQAIPHPKDSGTPAGLARIFQHMPAAAGAIVGWLTGHSPIVGTLLGETASRLGKEAPEAIKLGYLRFLGSDQPIKSEGFKAMVDFIHAASKGETIINRGAVNLFKGGAQVITANTMPNVADREKLDKIVSKVQDNPQKYIMNQENSHVGHYLPAHQVSLAQSTTQALTYLQSLKPKAYKASPLDRPIEPTKLEMSRYNRALDIAQQPAVVLQHIKDGTLQASDIKDLDAMYPALHQRMIQKLQNEMVKSVDNGDPIPYKTRIGISLFMGQPLDTSMTPTSIQAAQLAHLPPPSRGKPQEQGKTKKSTSAVGKSEKAYKTPMQAAEVDKSSRD